MNRTKSVCKEALKARGTHLNVEEGSRVDVDTVLLREILGDFHLVLLFDSLNGSLESRFLGELLQLLELIKMGDPVFANALE